MGVEIATRLGVAAAGTMHTQGFHTTGIAGHFGCAVAAGKLFKLSPQRLQYAQGFAGSTASAITEHRADGAWNKRLHPAWAGVGGITAAGLASGGFVGTKKIYEGADGIFRSHTGTRFNEVDMGAMTRRLGEEWLLNEVAIKPFPICHLLHACADSALAIRRKHNIRPEDIVKVRALLHPETFHYIAEPPEMRRRPVSDYMAKIQTYMAKTIMVSSQPPMKTLKEPGTLFSGDQGSLGELMRRPTMSAIPSPPHMIIRAGMPINESFQNINVIATNMIPY